MKCVKCVCVWLGVAWVKSSEWKRGLGLGFTNPVRTGGVLEVCLYLGCGCVGGICGEWVGSLDQCLEGWGGVGWCYVCVRCGSRLSV